MVRVTIGEYPLGTGLPVLVSPVMNQQFASAWLDMNLKDGKTYEVISIEEVN
jgi:hypothetical protein